MCLPVALVATGGCLATRSDIEKLQMNVAAMQELVRTEQARSDSITRTVVRAMTQQLAQQFAREFAVVSDSVRGVSSALQRLQGDVTLSMHGLRRDMVAVQEGIGLSQQRIQDLRTTVEATAAAPPQAAPAGVAAPAAAGASAPAAATLWSMARGQLISGATGSARNGFQLLVTEYPTHERAAESQMYIAETYYQERNRTAADSVYALVVKKYPGTEPASRSLWKRANLAIEVGDKDRARTLLQEIMDKYARSNEYELAADLLRTLKQP